MTSTLFAADEPPTCPACHKELPADAKGMTRCPSCDWLSKVTDGVADTFLPGFRTGKRRKRPPPKNIDFQFDE